MSAFTLDTSGFVIVNGVPIYWDAAPEGEPPRAHLNPLCQGFIRAMFEDRAAELLAKQTEVVGLVEDEFRPRIHFCTLGFRHIASAALERIVKECESFENIALGLGTSKIGLEHGRRFWRGRNDGSLKQTAFFAAFPPLLVSLDSEGKVVVADRVSA